MTNLAGAKKMTIMVLDMTMMTNPTKAIMMTMMMRLTMTNPTKAKKTKKMQTSIQAAMAVIPSTFGEFVVTMLKMLISTWRRRMVMMVTVMVMNNITILNRI